MNTGEQQQQQWTVLSGETWGVRDVLKGLGCRWDFAGSRAWEAPASALVEARRVVDAETRRVQEERAAKRWEIWRDYMGTLAWCEGEFTDTVYKAAIRAGSLDIPYLDAWQEIAGRVRGAKSGSVPDAWFDRNVGRGWRYGEQNAERPTAFPKGVSGTSQGLPERGPGEATREKPIFSNALLSRIAAGAQRVDTDWLASRSPIDPSGVDAGGFLAALYGAEERVVVFDVFESQGQWMWRRPVGDDAGGFVASTCAPAAVYEQGAKPFDLGGRAFDGRGPSGIWYLCNPVDGEWHWKTDDGEPKWSRRFHACVKSWRYMVIESDEADPRDWVKLASRMPLRVAAMYTSGGSSAENPRKQSVHVLIRLDARSKEEWDECKAEMKDVLIRLGADKQCMSGVRLTRPPGCWRLADKKGVTFARPRAQKLLWLNPRASLAALEDFRARESSLQWAVAMGQSLLTTDETEREPEVVSRTAQRLEYFASTGSEVARLAVKVRALVRRET